LRKGADILLDALPRLLEEYPELVVDIVGDDNIVIDGKTLKETFWELNKSDGIDVTRVKFHGSVSREELLRHYATCDIFVAPSRYESFGLIFVEAMIFSKPVVGIDVGGVAEVVTNEKDGLLIPTDDAELLGREIGRLVANPALRRRLGQAGRKTYEKRFSLERMLDESEAFFKRCVSQHIDRVEINAA
jgi:hypothetical protein